MGYRRSSVPNLYRDERTEIYYVRTKVHGRRLRLPSAEQFADILVNIESSGAWCAYDAAYQARFLAYSGCRIQEAANVKRDDVDLEAERYASPAIQCRELRISYLAQSRSIQPCTSVCATVGRQTRTPGSGTARERVSAQTDRMP